MARYKTIDPSGLDPRRMSLISSRRRSDSRLTNEAPARVFHQGPGNEPNTPPEEVLLGDGRLQFRSPSPSRSTNAVEQKLVKDLDFDRCEVLVRDGKGAKDRVTMLPASLVAALREHLERVRELHRQDLAAGHGEVYLPYALDRKYPAAGREWMWQYVFPTNSLSIDPRSGVIRRHHVQD